jgi:hypothetical protein
MEYDKPVWRVDIGMGTNDLTDFTVLYPLEPPPWKSQILQMIRFSSVERYTNNLLARNLSAGATAVGK